MSLNTDPNEGTGDLLHAIETYVAREHWEPILKQALLHATFLTGLALLLGLTPLNALALIHVVTSASGFMSGLMAMRMEQMGQDEAATSIARRAMAALLVSGVALLLVPLAL